MMVSSGSRVVNIRFLACSSRQRTTYCSGLSPVTFLNSLQKYPLLYPDALRLHTGAAHKHRMGDGLQGQPVGEDVPAVGKDNILYLVVAHHTAAIALAAVGMQYLPAVMPADKHRRYGLQRRFFHSGPAFPAACAFLCRHYSMRGQNCVGLPQNRAWEIPPGCVTLGAYSTIHTGGTPL